VFELDHFWCAVLVRGGQPALEEVARLNQMVVHRDHRHADGARLRIGQQCGPLGHVLGVDGSHET